MARAWGSLLLLLASASAATNTSFLKNWPLSAQLPINVNLPWDATFTPDGDMLFTEKCLGLSVLTRDGQRVRILDNSANGLLPDYFCLAQSGMHGVTLDPEYGVSGSPYRRDIYVFFSSDVSTPGNRIRRTNRVARITLADRITDPPVRRVDVVTDGMFKDAQNPVGGPGFHSGGRIGFGLPGTQYARTLFVTLGDNHNSTLPQDLWGIGSKILAVDRDGRPDPSNIIRPPTGDPRIFFYGVRNVQGLAFRPGSGEVFISEHGPNHSDEVTRLVNGGNGGWDPQNRPGLLCQGTYCGYSGNPTTMPMTDTTRFPNAVRPVWNYNARSAGMCAATFLQGRQWGSYEGWLAVSIMSGALTNPGDQNICLLNISPDGALLNVAYPTRIQRARYRQLANAPSGNLLAVTETRAGGGSIFEITPQELLQF